MNNLEKIVEFNADPELKLDNVHCCNFFKRYYNINNNKNKNKNISCCTSFKYNYYILEFEKYLIDIRKLLNNIKKCDNNISTCTCNQCIINRKLLEDAISKTNISNFNKLITI